MEVKLSDVKDRFKNFFRRNWCVILNKYTYIAGFFVLPGQRQHFHQRLVWQCDIFVHYLIKTYFENSYEYKMRVLVFTITFVRSIYCKKG